MAKKRTYDADKILTEYEKTLANQETKKDKIDEGTEAENTPVNIPELEPFHLIGNDEYENPDYDEYKRISLFMEYDVWERIQALCWSENEAVNKTVVDQLRTWSMNVPEETLENYRKATKQKHLDEWAIQRDVIQFWWQSCELRETLQIQSYKMNQSSLTVVENNGTVHSFYIHRNWITDGTTQFERVKTVIAKMKHIK